MASSNGISNSLIGRQGSALQTIQINAGGLLSYPVSNGSTDHLNALLLGGGTLFASAVNTAFGTWNFDGGVATAGSGNTSYMLGGNACLTQNSGGGTQFNVAAGDTLSVLTQICSGTSFINGTSQFPLAINGQGTLVLAGSNNFSTSTQMNNGTLFLANTAALAASPLVMSGGTVSFSGITQTVPLVSLAGIGGTLVLANTSGTPVNVSVGSGGAATNYSGLVTGSGSMTVAGGDLTLASGNNYTGTTILAGGVLTLGNPTALGNSTIQFSGGTLQYSAAANNADYSSSFGTASSEKFNIDTNGQSPTFSGNIKSSAGVLTKFGLGELTLSGSNSYTSGTIINGGLLQFAGSASVPKFQQITINSGGALVASSGTVTTVNGWLGTGRIQPASHGAIALTVSSTDTSVNFTLGTSGYPNLSLGAVGTVTYSGSITPGSGGYNLGGGGGTLWLATQLTNTGSLQPTPLTVGNGGGGTVVLANSADNWGGATTIVSVHFCSWATAWPTMSRRSIALATAAPCSSPTPCRRPLLPE